MSEKSKAQKIRELFTLPKKKTSWYNFKVGKIVENDIMSPYAKLDNIITNEDTGHVLMRFCCKNRGIDIIFKPEDIVICSSFVNGFEPLEVGSMEEGLKLISDAANKSGI